MKEKNHTIDILKGICILFVIIFHSGWETGLRLKFPFPFWAEMAVPVFMLVTGYVYTKSFRENRPETLGIIYNKKIYIKKITRYTLPFFYSICIGISVFVSFES